MDLGAYAQIDDIERIAKANNIEVPRLRGYRLMKDEKEVDYTSLFDGADIECVEELCTTVPFWSNKPYYWQLNDYTEYLEQFFMEYKDGEPVRVRWERWREQLNIGIQEHETNHRNG